MSDSVSFLPIGGIGDVTKNMYVYEHRGNILIVDCGLGFPDETMIGVDLLIPDVSYLRKKKHHIKGMVLTHGHEDHIGALPYILPQLPQFPIFATPLTAAFANAKLSEFAVTSHTVKPVSFDRKLHIGPFSISLVRVTHSVPDSANFIIKTPVGLFYHGSDFKFDETPADGRPSEKEKIRQAGKEGVRCLLCDCLRVEKEGRTPSERDIEEHFEREMQHCKGKFLVTTYSSNVSRLNQAIRVARKFNRKVCFIGRSLEKAKEIAITLGYIEKLDSREVQAEKLRSFKDRELLLLVAGSQGQENSAMVRIANDEDKFVRVKEDDVVVFSADPIPGNEVAINSLIDTLSKKGARVIYSAISDDLHVSGHGAREDISDMIRLTNPRSLIPIGGAQRHMVQFRNLALKLGFQKDSVLLLENGQEVIFGRDSVSFGRKVKVANVYVDAIEGMEVEGIVLRDRQRLAKEGILIVLVNIDGESGRVLGKVDFVSRGFVTDDVRRLFTLLEVDIKRSLGKHKGLVKNLPFIRNVLSEHIEKTIFKRTRRRPLVFPIIIAV